MLSFQVFLKRYKTIMSLQSVQKAPFIIVLFTALLMLPFSLQAQNYATKQVTEPSIQDMKAFYKVLKIIYTDMPAVMTGLDVMLNYNFEIDQISKQSELKQICDMVHAAERISLIASQSQVHPHFQANVDNLAQIMSAENAAVIKEVIQQKNYSCL